MHRQFLLIVFIVSLLSSVIGCDAVARKEVLRLSSPDNIVDAVLIETDGGATTPFGYLLYIVPHGNTPQKSDAQLNAVDFETAKYLWREPKLLEIQYKGGKIYHFSNFWYSKEVQNLEYKVELRLVYVGP